MTVSLSLPKDTLGFLIAKARAFDAEVEMDDPDSGSNAADDGGVAILEDNTDNPTREELSSFLSDLNVDALCELVALVWVGRGDYDRASWREALKEARASQNQRSVEYLMGTPMLGDLIEEGLCELGIAVPLPEEDAA